MRASLFAAAEWILSIGEVSSDELSEFRYAAVPGTFEAAASEFHSWAANWRLRLQ
jgi:hypothetical protein